MIPTPSSQLSYPSPSPTQKRSQSLSYLMARKRKNPSTFPRDDNQNETDSNKRTSNYNNDDSAFIKSPKNLQRYIQGTLRQGVNHSLTGEMNQRSPPLTPRKEIQIKSPGSRPMTTPRRVETPDHDVLVSSPILIPDSDDNDDAVVEQRKEEEEEEEDVPLIRKRHGRPLPGSISASTESWRHSQNDEQRHNRKLRSCRGDDEDADTEFEPNSKMYDEVFFETIPISSTNSPVGNSLRRAKNSAMAHRTRMVEPKVLAEDFQESVGVEDNGNMMMSDGQGGALQSDCTIPDEPSAITSTYTALGTSVLIDTDEDEDGFVINDLSKWLEEDTAFTSAPAPSGPGLIARGMTVSSPVPTGTKGKIYADDENFVPYAVLPRQPGKNSKLACDNSTSTIFTPISSAKEKTQPPFVVALPDDVHTPFESPRSLSSFASTIKNINAGKDSRLLESSSLSLQDTSLRQVQETGLKRSLGDASRGRTDLFANRDEKNERFKRSRVKDGEETAQSSPEFTFECLLSDFPKHHTTTASRRPISLSDRTSSIQPIESTTICPLCSCRFSDQEILVHASDCMGPDLGGPDQAEIEDNPGNSPSSSSFLPSPSHTQRRTPRTTNQNRARPGDSLLSRQPELWDEIDGFSDDSLEQVQENTLGNARKGRTRVGLEKQVDHTRLRRESPGYLLSSEEDEGPSSCTECPLCRRMVSVAEIEAHVEEELAAMEKDQNLPGNSREGVNKERGKAQMAVGPASVSREERVKRALGFTKDDIPVSSILTFSSRRGTEGKSGRDGALKVVDELVPRDQVRTSAGTTHRSEDEDEDDRWVDVSDEYWEENVDGDASGDGQQVDEDDGYMSPLEGFVSLNDHGNNPGSDFAEYFEQFGPRQGRLDGGNAPTVSTPASAQSHQRQSLVATASAATPAPTKSRRRRTPGVPDFEVEGWQNQEQNLKYAGGGSAKSKKKGDSEGSPEKWRKTWKNGRYVFQMNKAWLTKKKQETKNDGNGEKRIRKEKPKERGKGKARTREKEATTPVARKRSQPAANNYYADGDLDDGINTGGLAWEGLGVAEYGSEW